MRHYELVLMIHPDQEKEQVLAMIERYKKFVDKHGGKIHRFEDWDRKPLSYPIMNAHKAHYLLFNVELPQVAIQELRDNLNFNDAILRHLILNMDGPVTEMSPMLKNKDKEQPYRGHHAQHEGELPSNAVTASAVE